MFRASQCLIKKVAAASAPVGRSFATYKTSTGLVGLAVDVNGRETLLDLPASIKETVKVCGGDRLVVQLSVFLTVFFCALQQCSTC